MFSLKLLLCSSFIVGTLSLIQVPGVQQSNTRPKVTPSSLPVAVATPTTTLPPSPLPQPTLQIPIVVQMPSTSKDNVDYLLVGVQIGGVVINVLALLGLLYNLRKTRDITDATIKSMQISERNLTELKAARIQENAPHVITYIDMQPDDLNILYLVIKNIGRTVAKDITFEFNPTLMTGFGNRLHEFDSAIIKEGIKSLAPGQELRRVLDSATNYFGSMAKHLESPLPLQYKVKVSFSGGALCEKEVSEQVIDLTMFKDASKIQKKDEQDLIKAVEGVAQASGRSAMYLERVSNTLFSGLWVKNSDPSSAEANVEQWKLNTTTNLKEFKLLWKFLYAGDYKRPVRNYLEGIQVKALMYSSRILTAAAAAPPSISAESINLLVKTSMKLEELSQVRFFMDGEKSEPDFNIVGDETVTLIDEAIQTLNNEALLTTE
jgi:hypothetical protein